MKRWWLRGRMRTLKKRAGTPFLDGVTYSWRAWERALNEVRALREGDSIYNPYTKQMGEVRAVHFVWKHPFLGERHGKERYLNLSFVDEFWVETKDNYYIYDCPSVLEVLRLKGTWDYSHLWA